MKRILFILIFLLLFLSCTSKKNDDNLFLFSNVGIEKVENVTVHRINDDDIFSKKEKSIRYEQNDLFYKLFGKPFKNLNFHLYREHDGCIKSSPIELLERLSISSSVVDAYNFSEVSLYSIVRVTTDIFSVYLIKTGNDIFRIFLLEINGNDDFYESSFPFESTISNIEYSLGEANFFTKSKDCLIYADNKLNQINFILDNGIVKRIQYIMWEGI